MFSAQQALSKISIEEERFRLAKQRQEQPAAQPVQQEPVQQQAAHLPPHLIRKRKSGQRKILGLGMMKS